MDCDFDRLDLSTNPYLEKNLEFLCNWIDDLSNEQLKFNQYTRNAQRQKQVFAPPVFFYNVYYLIRLIALSSPSTLFVVVNGNTVVDAVSCSLPVVYVGVGDFFARCGVLFCSHANVNDAGAFSFVTYTTPN